MNPTGAIQRGRSSEKTRERRKKVSYRWEEVCEEGEFPRMSGGRSCPFLGSTPGRWCIPQQIVQCCTHLRLPGSLQPDGDRVLPAAVNWTGTVSSTGVTSVQRIFMFSEGGQCAGTAVVLGKGDFPLRSELGLYSGCVRKGSGTFKGKGKKKYYFLQD